MTSRSPGTPFNLLRTGGLATRPGVWTRIALLGDSSVGPGTPHDARTKREGMAARDHEDELQNERNYIAGLYARLDADRAEVDRRYKAALRSPVDPQNGATLVERDAEVRAMAKEMQRLDVADYGLCFGRLETL